MACGQITKIRVRKMKRATSLRGEKMGEGEAVAVEECEDKIAWLSTVKPQLGSTGIWHFPPAQIQAHPVAIDFA